MVALSAVVAGVGPTGAAPSAVAVFAEPRFPYYMTDAHLSPGRVCRWLSEVGLDAQRLTAAQLADPAAFNADRFGLLVHGYGNTYPEPALQALRAFHARGGCLLMVGGTPFCHPCVPTGAQGWGFGQNPSALLARDTDVAHSGAASLRLVGRKGDWFGPTTALHPAAAGEVFTVGAWVRTSNDLTFDDRTRLWIRSFDGAGRFCGQGGPTIPPPGSEWTWVEGSYTVPGNAATADLSIQMWCASGTVWVDDVVFSRGPACDPAANLQPNPGFEDLPDVPTWEDLGHRDDFTHEGVGTGSLIWIEDTEAQAYLDREDRLGLGCIPWAERRLPGAYCVLDPLSLPAGDRAEGLVGVGKAGREVGWPVALIEHGCPQFRGALDLWCGSNMLPMLSREEQRHLVVKSAIHLLARSGRITAQARNAALARFEALSPPEDLARPPRIVDEPSPYPTFFPRSPAPDPTLTVLDLRSLAQDERFFAVVLQGLVNRQRPRVYLLSGVFGGEEQATEFWLDRLVARGYHTRPLPDLCALAAEFAAHCRQAVLYPAELWSDPGRTPILNVVALLCAVRDLVPVTPELNDRLGLPVAFDAGEAWTSVREAHEWAMAELWPRANHHVLAFQHPRNIPFYDYLVAFRAFPIAVFLETPEDTEDLFEQMLRETPPNIPVMGCWGRYGEQPPLAYLEHELVSLTSQWGKPFVVSQWAANLSVHSGVPVAAEELRQRRAPAPTLDPSKVYLVLDFSDGDNLQYVYSSFFGPRWWGNPGRGSLNLAWSVGPGAVDLMPDVLAHYYATATPRDEFIAAVSGAGYCYPDIYASRYGPEAGMVFDGFLRLTAGVMAKADLQVLNPFRGSRENYERYATRIPALTGILADYGRGAKLTYEEATYSVGGGGVPVFRNLFCHDGQGDNVAKTVEGIREATPEQRPAFLHIFVINWWNTPEDLARVMEQLGDDYVACTASQFVDLWRQSQGH